MTAVSCYPRLVRAGLAAVSMLGKVCLTNTAGHARAPGCLFSFPQSAACCLFTCSILLPLSNSARDPWLYTGTEWCTEDAWLFAWSKLPHDPSNLEPSLILNRCSLGLQKMSMMGNGVCGELQVRPDAT